MTRIEAEKRAAHAALDEARRGDDVPLKRINWALRMLGDLVGLRHYDDDGEPVLQHLEPRS